MNTISTLTLRRVTSRVTNTVVALTFLSAYVVATACVPLTSGTAYAATNNGQGNSQNQGQQNDRGGSSQGGQSNNDRDDSGNNQGDQKDSNQGGSGHKVNDDQGQQGGQGGQQGDQGQPGSQGGQSDNNDGQQGQGGNQGGQGNNQGGSSQNQGGHDDNDDQGQQDGQGGQQGDQDQPGNQNDQGGSSQNQGGQSNQGHQGHNDDQSKDEEEHNDEDEDDDKDKVKVFVCKYVGTPWVDERLKEGKNPISVGVPEGQDRTPGTYFNDAHGSSFVLAYDTGQAAPGVEECPAPRVPIEVTPVAPQQQVVCWANNDVITLPEIEGVSYNATAWVDGSLTVTATANDHFYFPEGAQSEWIFTDEDTPCAVTPVAPTVVVVCGANNDTVTMPTVEGVTYASTGWVNNSLTVTATAGEGYMFPEETVASWTFADANTPCGGNVLGDTTTTPSVTVAATPLVASTATLADTGTDMTLVALLSSGLLGAAVLTVMQNSKRGSKIMDQLRRLSNDMQRAFAAPFVLPTA